MSMVESRANSRNLKRIMRLGLSCLASALVVPLLELALGRSLTMAEIFRESWISAAYSLFIGGPLSIAAPIVWPRSYHWSRLRRWTVRVAMILGVTTFGCLLAGLCLLAVYGGGYAFWESFRTSFIISLILTSFAVAFISTYERYKEQLQVSEMQLKAKELERERALTLATEARLSSLESRVHPHFLFNTINSISSLIHDDPRRAEKMLSQMAGLLRFSLDSAHSGLVPLSKELKIVADYLEIEKARFNERLRYEIRMPEELLDVPVLPLSLQTLVENSVKYAVNSRRAGATILVSVKREPQLLKLQVSDDGPGFRSLEMPAGHGLSNLQERLTNLFGEQGKLLVSNSLGCTSVSIEMPLRDALPGHQTLGAALSL
jgi:two-component system, LytTR family, sensor histidine kinase AlgZ